METKIQLNHPAGKKAVRMDKDKYDILRKAIFRCLKNKTLTHTELLEAIIADFKKNKIKFAGSIEWYMESVKLDLEANKLIQRVKDKLQLKFQLVSKKEE
jgi:hypothetical protein